MLEIEVDSLGIPDTEYESIVKLPSNEFQRICQNLSTWGESVLITTNKKGIKFSVEGEIGSGNVHLKQDSSSDEPVCHITLPVTYFLGCGHNYRS
jgi:proliferating cell nuclear antigen